MKIETDHYKKIGHKWKCAYEVACDAVEAIIAQVSIGIIQSEASKKKNPYAAKATLSFLLDAQSVSFISYDKRFDCMSRNKDDDELECVIRDSVLPKRIIPESINLNIDEVSVSVGCFSPSNKLGIQDNDRGFSFSM
jgi:hypothetical protein